MIHPICFTCERDEALYKQMRDSLFENSTCLYMHGCTGQSNGAGWDAVRYEINEIRHFILIRPTMSDADFIIKVDSDVIFLNDKIFNALTDAGLQGLQSEQPFNSKLGEFKHMSGACIFIRVDVAKKICELSEDELDKVRYNHFKAYNITENEDIALSYLAQYVGATVNPLPKDLMFCGDIENELQNPSGKHCVVHLNLEIKEFMGVPITGKWDIPKILKQKNIEL